MAEAELGASGELVGAARGADGDSADHRCQLNRCGADSARDCVQENALPLGEPALKHYSVVGGEKRFGNSGGLVERHTLWNGHELGGLGDYSGRHRASTDDAHDSVAWLPGRNGRAHRIDDSGEL